MRGLVFTCSFALALSACRCGETVTPATSELTATELELDFGRIAIGAALELPVTVRNGGLAPAELTVTVARPFAVDVTPTGLGGAGELTLTVRFAPSQLGAATGTLSLGPGHPSVALRGEGLAACTVSETCRVPRFDLETRTCVTDVAGDGAACVSPCIADGGSCRTGACIGVATTCVDGDACTLDACRSDGTCTHPAVECVVTDPCLATYCDRDAGCATRAVEDGVPCGEAMCEGSLICVGGRCEFKERPNAELDCRYTSLAVYLNQTCAVTAGRSVKCWGDNGADQLGRGFPSEATPPGAALGLSDVHSVATSRHGTWGARSTGIAKTNETASVNIDAAAIGAAGAHVCGLELGAVKCTTDAGLIEVARDVVAMSVHDGEVFGLATHVCAVNADGGVRCGPPELLAPVPTPAPATAVSAARFGSGCALLGGTVYCWGKLLDGGAGVLWDGGVTALDFTDHSFLADTTTACAARGADVECVGYQPGRHTLPAPALDLAVGQSHVCALMTDGNVACWGSNFSGQLGDRSQQPIGVYRRAETARWLGAFEYDLLIEDDAGIASIGWTASRTVTTDAGATYHLPSSTRRTEARAHYESGCDCFTTNGQTSCPVFDPLPRMPTTCVEYLAIHQYCLSYGDSEVQCARLPFDGGSTEHKTWDAGGPVKKLSAGEGDTVCALRADGQVRCSEPAASARVEAFSGADDLCLSGRAGCVHLDGGALRCWGDWVGSATPVTPLGSWPIVRQMACGSGHFCTVSGTNIVQCWGNNRLGQLGLDGPSRTTAVSVPMPEPTRSIAVAHTTTCALLESGKIVCWGHNPSGQVGLPALTGSTTPRVVTQ
ncbi:MAG: choice-of-anchor D domain-containing protein [Myxococcaceae bacterium]|nr:choice-of-anchor D domain-containing protein [Myxococcaceae bacterium]